MKSIEDFLNTEINGRFLFSGARVDTQPVSFGLSTVANFQSTFDGARVTIPSALVKPGRVIALREGSRKNEQIKICLDTAKGRGVPGWLELDADQFQGTVRQLPTREDIQIPIQEQLIVELYSK